MVKIGPTALLASGVCAVPVCVFGINERYSSWCSQFLHFLSVKSVSSVWCFQHSLFPVLVL